MTAAILFAAVISACVGKYPISFQDILHILVGRDGVSDMTRRVFLTLRLPRTLMAILSGTALGLAGSVYQLIFKNPLASPDIIGIAGGANLGAAAAIVLVSSSGVLPTAIGAFWGGLAAVVCVMLLTRATGSRSTATYVLAGIVINAVSKSLIMVLKYFADPDNEAKVQKAFTKLSAGKTVIMIAHRLSSVVESDRICVLKDGGIVEQGNHETLLAQGGLYAHMWEAYNKSVSWKVGKGEY